MQTADLVKGRRYAERVRPRDAECPLREVVFIGPAKAGKAKIRHAAGDLDGLEEWVPTRTLICPWAERRAFLRDETRWNALREAYERDCDPVVEEAIDTVLAATGDADGLFRAWTVDTDQADRLWRRAGLDGSPDEHPLAYTDRHGKLNLPYETALKFAQAFAAAEPEPCIHYIQEEEDRLRANGYVPGERFSHMLLRGTRPAHALIREWTQATELGLLQKENDRLHRLLSEALYELRRSGLERAANRLDRALRGQ